MYSWREVGAFCDRLIANLAAVTSGDQVRAVLLAISAVEVDRRPAGSAVTCGGVGSVPGGLSFLDAALVLLRVRLADALTLGVWDEPVPYSLTEKAVRGNAENAPAGMRGAL